MRLVGASAFIIQLPFILETLVATMVGTALAIGLLWAMVKYGVGYLADKLPVNFITTADVVTVSPWLVAIAAGLAMLTAWFTLRRYLRVWSRTPRLVARSGLQTRRRRRRRPAVLHEGLVVPMW